jgi:hypothetical protein
MSIIAAGTTTTTALSSTGNTDGTLQFQVNGTTPSVTLNALGAVGVGAVPAFGTSGQVLTSAGSTAAPTWATPAAVNLSTGVTGTLPVTNGGTGQTALSAVAVGTSTNLAGGSNGTIPYQSAAGTTQMLAVGTAGQVLQTNGAGAPTWVTPGGGSWVYINTVTATAASTADVEGMDSTYDMYVIVAEGVRPATANGALSATLKVGGSYQTSSYGRVVASVGTGGTSLSVTQNVNGNQIFLSTGNVETGTDNATLFVYIPFAGSTNRKKMISFVYNYNRSNDVNSAFGTGQYHGSSAALTGVRFEAGSTISGVFRLYGIKNN